MIGTYVNTGTILGGSLIGLVIGFNFLNLTRIRIGNFIPAVLYAIVWSHFFPK